MLAEDPIGLALRISSFGEAVAKHEQLRRRVSNLDWTRNPELSIAVNLDLSRPDKLDSLAANIPQLMMDLAQNGVSDEHFTFIPWRPKKRSRPILIPVPKNAVEDAMEAILEDMASDSEPEVVVEKIIEEMPIVAVEETVDVVEKIIEEIVIDKEVSESSSEPEILEGDSPAFDQLLRSLGLSEEADMLIDSGDITPARRALASHVGVEPRDMRLDRLLRLSLRLIPKGDDGDGQRHALLATLAELAGVLSKWTRTRLEARHNGAKGILLEDASILGQALERIPGPGTPMPLDADEYELPKLDDIDGLSNEVSVLKRRILLANSGGVR
jgi:hypothetical protein